jgi:rhamnogalacturonyl hydrolase YesR
MTVPVTALLEHIAERAAEYRYRIWGFGEGMALHGLLRAAVRLHRPEWIDRVAELVCPTLHRGPDPADHLIAVEVLTELGRLRPAVDVRPAIARFRRAVLDAHRPVPGRPAVHRPDLPELASTVWVDCLHTDGPGLVLANEPRQAGRLIDDTASVLQDGSGLFSHSYDVATGRANGVHWGRGQGWALHGLIAVDGAAARRRSALLLDAMARWEHEGRWRTIVDDPGAPFEASVSALMAAGILHGVRTGRVERVRLALAERALTAAAGALDADGGLPVSEATPAGTPEVYLSRGTGVFPWGQGPLLLALLEHEELA